MPVTEEAGDKESRVVQASSHIGSQITYLRTLAIRAIEDWRKSAVSDRWRVVMRIRTTQDQITRLKHRHPAIANQPSPLAWADTWDPRRET